MTSDAEKNSTHCLICNGRVGPSSRTCVRIFNNVGNASEKPFADTISCLLDIEITVDNIHSVVLCKKCSKSCNEVSPVPVNNYCL